MRVPGVRKWDQPPQQKEKVVKAAVDIYIEAIAAGEGGPDAEPWTEEYRELAEPFLREIVNNQFDFMHDLGLLKSPEETENGD